MGMPKLKNFAVVDDEADAWTPRAQPGGIYCSPRCGCKCTRLAYDKAVARSLEIASQLGVGWQTRVWENGGWHWEVTKGPRSEDFFDGGGIIVWEDRHKPNGGFSAKFRSVVNGTNCVTQFFADAATAEDAIGLVRQDVRTFISRIEADLASSL